MMGTVDVIKTQALEYNIVEHCNLSCKNCDHASPILDRKLIAPDVISSDLEALARVLHTGELKIIGGEPLLHPQLLEILDRCRAIGIADTLTVATNGTLLHKMGTLFWKKLDRLWLSLYPGIRLGMTIEAIESISHVEGFTLSIFSMDSFRHTLLNRKIEDDRVVERIYRNCDMPEVDYCHTLRAGRYFKCSPAPFAADRLAKARINYTEKALDGVAVHDNPTLVRDLRDYLSSDHPLSACSYCLGTSGKWFEHRQLNRKGIIQASAKPDSWKELLNLDFK